MTQKLLDFATDTALGAGEIIRGKYGRLKTWRTKEGRGDIVTEADTEAEYLIIQRIQRAFPSHNILTEESGSLPGDAEDLTWYVDPLDGTGNYARGIPFFCTTLAVARGAELLAAATYDPLRMEMFKASAGNGAYLNRRRLRLTQDANLEDAMVSISWSRRRPGSDRFPLYIQRLAPRTSYLRRFGSAALAIAYAAAGRIDAYIQGAITPWDIAAGVLLVSEAGGTVTGFGGEPVDLSSTYSAIVAANSALHERLLKEVLS
ncbi:MAG: inositol monophosphatase family protein [Armatimonadota bacterium]|nr:inositol monophosphatase family protein [Armatimonadota bacterium]